MIRLQRYKNTDWINLNDFIRYKENNGFILVDIRYEQKNVNVNKWTTIGKIPYKLKNQFNFVSYDNSSVWDSVTSCRIEADGVVLIGGTKNNFAVRQCISIPIDY